MRSPRRQTSSRLEHFAGAVVLLLFACNGSPQCWFAAGLFALWFLPDFVLLALRLVRTLTPDARAPARGGPPVVRAAP